jgi:hypothetical protein
LFPPAENDFRPDPLGPHQMPKNAGRAYPSSTSSLAFFVLPRAAPQKVENQASTAFKVVQVALPLEKDMDQVLFFKR